QAIRKTLEKQKVVSHFGGDADVVALAREGERVAIGLLLYREGDLGERKHYLFKTPQEDEEVLESFLLQYYAASPVVPREILVPFFWEGLKPLEEILSEKRGGPVSLKVPEKGEKSAKVELARQNAQERLRHEVLTEESREEILTQLQSKLGLNRLPRRMECYDISNIQGQMAVGSCVSFLDGVPDKSAYRRFKIKTVPQANDFAMLYEVLSRRFSRGDWPTPDLIVIDGGKGQLHAAEAALKDKNVIHVDLISLAKEKAYPGDDKRRKFFEPAPKRPERVFLPGRKNPVVLHPNSSALHVLVRIRDEAHRFGITYHRKLRSRRALHSTLDGIEGVGPGRKKELLRHFGSLKKIQTAPAEEIGRVKGISLSLAEKIVQHFQSQKN
ncbi:MAG: excinuclease ABC subunit UvrC, partial [bacterium]